MLWTNLYPCICQKFIDQVFSYGKWVIVPTIIAPNFQSPKATHNLIIFNTPASGGSKLSVYSVGKYQQRLLYPSWHISCYCFGTFPSRLYFKMSSSSLEPYSLVLWSELIWIICVIFHSRKTLLYSQYLFFQNKIT